MTIRSSGPRESWENRATSPENCHRIRLRGNRRLIPDDSPDAYREKYQQLQALGFRPLGIYWSRIGRTITTEDVRALEDDES